MMLKQETRSRFRPIHWRGFFGALVLAVAFLLAPSAEAFRYINEDQGHDFLLIGIGVFRQNLTSAGGDADIFEDSEDGLPDDYSNRSRLSLFGEGEIYSNYSFRLKANYDQEEAEDNEDFTALLELHRGENFMILGDHEDGTFEDTTFTALDEQVRGVTLHGQAGIVGATVMAGALRGETITETIRGDGTSGPYRLEEAPVIDGSEQVMIEIRDRTAPNRVIQRRLQSRGRDYTIDYDDGEITFDRPVEEQEFRGNPVFIIITYQFETTGDRYQRSTWGTRLAIAPNDSVSGGVTYLADGPWQDSDTGDAWDGRREIYGADLAVKLTERYKVGFEVAKSETPELDESTDADAIRVDLDTNPIDPLRIYGGYWKVERDFLTFGNLNLQSDNVVDEYDLDEPFSFESQNLEFDLDPNISVAHGTDEESYGLSAAYDLNDYHTIAAGWRETNDNIPGEDETPQNTLRHAFASYKRIHPEGADWLLGVERFEREDDEIPTPTLDSETTRLLGAVKHPVGTFRVLGDTYLQLAYQYEDTQDKLDSNEDFKIHDAQGRLEMHPVQEVTTYFEVAEQWVWEAAEDDYTERTDAVLLGAQGKYSRYFDIDASAKYSWRHDLILEEVAEEGPTYTLRWTSLPLDVLKTRLKMEYRNTEDKLEGSEIERSIYGGEVFWDILPNLTADLTYDYETDKATSPTTADEKYTYEDFSARLDYQFRTSLKLFGGYRLESEEVDVPELTVTTTDTTTWLAGVKYDITEKWNVLSSYKYQILEGAIEDEREKFFAELGYRINRFLQIALGYEIYDYTDEDTGEEYDADVAYVSLTGMI